MRAKTPFWQNYWYELRFREAGTASFEPMDRRGPQQVPNQGLAAGSLDAFIDYLFDDAVDEMYDSDGELQILIYTEATPGPNTEPVVIRTIKVGRR